MKLLTLHLNGEPQKVWAQIANGKIWVHWNGKTFSKPFEKRSSLKTKKQSSSQTDKIFSPMPGKIIKVFFQKGQTVKKGDVIVIMEAMKMEYSLSSEINGVIENIFCSPQEQVPADKLLVQLREENKK